MTPSPPDHLALARTFSFGALVCLILALGHQLKHLETSKEAGS